MAGRQRSGFANDRRTYTYACCNNKQYSVPAVPQINAYYQNRFLRLINSPQYLQQLVYYVSR